MNTLEWMATAGALVLGTIVQSASGFGLAIVAVPLLVASGRSLPESVALVVGTSMVQSALGLRSSTARPPWRLNLRVALGQWLGLPAGVWVMGQLHAADPTVTKQWIGAVVIALLTVVRWVNPQPRERLHPFWAPSSGLAAGLIGGSVGMGGPPLVFFAMAHHWDRDHFRTFLWRQMLINCPVVITMLSLRFGGQEALWLLRGAALAPLLWLATWVGLWLSRRWQRVQLMRAATVLLYVVGVSGLLAPWWSAPMTPQSRSRASGAQHPENQGARQ